MITTLRELTSGALDLAFPSTCGSGGSLLWSGCLVDSPAVPNDVCSKCAEPLEKPGICTRCVIERSSLDRMCGSYLYESPTRPAVLAFKLDDVRALGSVLCGMFNTEPMISAEPDIAVTVPMHKSRVRERGYNQSAILAQKLSYPLGVEYRGDLSFRSINTVSQPEQPTAVVRRGALSGVFAEELKSVGAIVGRRILVVDDVFTTGSSLNAVSATLKSTQASWVGGAARTLQPIGEFN